MIDVLESAVASPAIERAMWTFEKLRDRDRAELVQARKALTECGPDPFGAEGREKPGMWTHSVGGFPRPVTASSLSLTRRLSRPSVRSTPAASRPSPSIWERPQHRCCRKATGSPPRWLRCGSFRGHVSCNPARSRPARRRPRLRIRSPNRGGESRTRPTARGQE